MNNERTRLVGDFTLVQGVGPDSLDWRVLDEDGDFITGLVISHDLQSNVKEIHLTEIIDSALSQRISSRAYGYRQGFEAGRADVRDALGITALVAAVRDLKQ